MSKFFGHPKLAIALVAPQLAVVVIFFIWPALTALMQSFYFSDAFGLQHHFAGWLNFSDLWSNPDYFKAFKVTFILAVAITGLIMVLGMLIAILVNGVKKGQSVYKVLLLWPYAVAPAVAAILWRFLCHPTLGWIAIFLNQFGIDFNYLTHPKQAMLVVVLSASWQQFSYNFLFYFAALKLIPQALIDAAIMDGASVWRIFWQIIFPLLAPTTFFLLIMNLIYCFFDTFGIIQVMTNGGPGNSTTTLIFKAYQDGLIGMDPGSSSAQSVILMLLVVALTFLQFRFLEKRIHYQ